MQATTRLQTASSITMALLIALVVVLMLQLSQAWRNERFLDAELNKNHIKGTK